MNLELPSTRANADVKKFIEINLKIEELTTQNKELRFAISQAQLEEYEEN